MCECIAPSGQNGINLKQHAESVKRRRRSPADHADASESEEEDEDEEEVEEEEEAVSVDDSEEDVYPVEKILGRRKVGSNVEYLVKWEGYGTHEATWEPRSNILNDALLETFEREADERDRHSGQAKTKKTMRGLFRNS